MRWHPREQEELQMFLIVLTRYDSVIKMIASRGRLWRLGASAQFVLTGGWIDRQALPST